MSNRSSRGCLLSCFGADLWSRTREEVPQRNELDIRAGRGCRGSISLDVLPCETGVPAADAAAHASNLAEGGSIAQSAAQSNAATAPAAASAPMQPRAGGHDDAHRRNTNAPACPATAAAEQRSEPQPSPGAWRAPEQQQQHETAVPQSAIWRGGEDLDPKIRIPFKEITLHKVIGKGSFKTVYRGSWNNTHVAVVAMRRGGLVAEARLLQRMSTHPNLVQLYRWSADEAGNEYLVMELLQLGSLDAVLRSIGRQLLTQTKMTIVEQVVSACLELSREGLVHGDLAARNLLLKSLEPPHVKLADFGLARPALPTETAAVPMGPASSAPSAPDDVPATLLPSPAAAEASAAAALSQRQQQQQQQQRPIAPFDVVPARWAAPEVLAGGAPSEAGDVWSFGVTSWEIFANGAEPYAALSNRQILAALRSGCRLDRPRGCPLELWQLVLQCWSDDPRDRPRFAEIAAIIRSWREEYVSSKIAAASATGPTSSASGPGIPAASATAVAAATAPPGGFSDTGSSNATALLPPETAAAATTTTAGGGRVLRTTMPIAVPVAFTTAAASGDARRARGSSVAAARDPRVSSFAFGTSPPASRGGSGPSGFSPPVAGAPGRAMSTHMSFEIAEPAIMPAYTSGSSVAVHSSGTPRVQPSMLDGGGGGAASSYPSAAAVQWRAAARPGAAAFGGGGLGNGAQCAPTAAALATRASHSAQGMALVVQGAAFAAGEGAAGAAAHGTNLSSQQTSDSALRSPCGRSSAGARSSAGTQLSSVAGFLEARMDRGHRLGRSSAGIGQEGGPIAFATASAFVAAIAPFGPSTALRQAATGSLSSGRTPSTILGASIFYDSLHGNSNPSNTNPSNSVPSISQVSGSNADGSSSRRGGGGGGGGASGDMSSGLLSLAAVPEHGGSTPMTMSNTTAATNSRSPAWTEALPGGGGGAAWNHMGPQQQQQQDGVANGLQRLPMERGRGLDAAAAAAAMAGRSQAVAASRALASPYVRIGELAAPPLALHTCAPLLGRAFGSETYWTPSTDASIDTAAHTSHAQPGFNDVRVSLASPFTSAGPSQLGCDDLSLRSMVKVSGPVARGSTQSAEPPSSIGLAGLGQPSNGTGSMDGAGPSSVPASLPTGIPSGMMLLPSIVSSGCVPSDDASLDLGQLLGSAGQLRPSGGHRHVAGQAGQAPPGEVRIALDPEPGEGDGERATEDAAVASAAVGPAAAGVEQQQLSVMSFESSGNALSGSINMFNHCGQATSSAAGYNPLAVGAAAGAASPRTEGANGTHVSSMSSAQSQPRQLQQTQNRTSLSLALRAPRTRRGSNGSQASSTHRCGAPADRTSWQGSSRTSAASSRGGAGSGRRSRLLGTELVLDTGSTPSGPLEAGARQDAGFSPTTSVRSARTVHSQQSAWSARSAGGGVAASSSRRGRHGVEPASARLGNRSALASPCNDRSGSLGAADAPSCNAAEGAGVFVAAGMRVGGTRGVAFFATHQTTRGSPHAPESMHDSYDEEELHCRAAFGQAAQAMVVQMNEFRPTGNTHYNTPLGPGGMECIEMLQARHMMEVLQELPESSSEGLDAASLLVASRSSTAAAAATAAQGVRRTLLVARGFEEYEGEAGELMSPLVSSCDTPAAGAGADALMENRNRNQGGHRQHPQQQQQLTAGSLLLNAGREGSMAAPGVRLPEGASAFPGDHAGAAAVAASHRPEAGLARTSDAMSAGAPSWLFGSTRYEIVAERQAIFDYLQTRQWQELQQERDW